MRTPKAEALIFYAHGSGDKSWNNQVACLARRVSRSLGKERVNVAFMEKARPSLETAVSALSRRGVVRIKILPLFFAQAGHVTRDITRLTLAAQELWPKTRLELLPALGASEAFAAFLTTFARDMLSGQKLKPGGTVRSRRSSSATRSKTRRSSK